MTESQHTQVNDQPNDLSMADQGTPPQDQSMADQANTSKKDHVAYESYRKVVGQNKRLSERATAAETELERIRSEQRNAEEQKLAEQNRWKELHESKAKELEEARAQLNQTHKMIEDAKKLRALSTLAPIRPEFHNTTGTFNLDNIIVNPDTGEIDDSSVQREAERIRNQFPVILQTQSGPKLDNNAPVPNNTGSLSIHDFANLPANQRAAKVNEVAGVPDWMKMGSARISKPQ
jgi:hypothetical protein